MGKRKEKVISKIFTDLISFFISFTQFITFFVYSASGEYQFYSFDLLQKKLTVF